MTLKFVPTVDPRSMAAKVLPEEERPFAGSPEGDTLSQLLWGYLEGQIRGESLLVSGHRGAGKTTLVWNTIRQVEDQWRNAKVYTGHRDGPVGLLPIALDGPDLFPRYADPKDSDKTGAADHGDDSSLQDSNPTGAKIAADKPEAGTNANEVDIEKRDDPTTLFLRRVVASLYRDTARRFSERMRDWMCRGGKPAARAHRGGREMAGYLELELDTAPLPDVLRDYWDRANALDKGVLFPGTAQLLGEPRPRVDQGIREILALSTTAIAYQKVIGKLVRKRDSGAEMKAERTAEAGNVKAAGGGAAGAGGETAGAAPTAVVNVSGGGMLGSAIRDLTAPLLGLLAGGFGGAAFLKTVDESSGTTTERVLGAVAIVVGAALAMMFGAKVVTKTNQSRTRKDTNILEIDARPRTLTRDLPRVIERLTDAGLLPVFVVDELDKVRHLKEGMKVVMRHIKALANDNAFFLFLTDRDYFDYLRQVDRDIAYARPLTYFSQRLFVSYRPADMWRFILDSIRQDRSGDQSEEELSAEAADRMILPFVVMQLSRMHCFEVRDEILRLSGPDGSIRTEWASGEVMSHPRYLVNVVMQIAILLVLRQNPELFGRMRHDPYFVQQIYDAVYYPARQWKRGDDVLNVSEDTFGRYMFERVNPPDEETVDGTMPDETFRTEQKDELPKSGSATMPERHIPAENGTNGEQGNEKSRDLELTDSDFLLLHGSMKEVVRYVSDPLELCSAWDSLNQYEASDASQEEEENSTGGAVVEESPVSDEFFQLIPPVPSQVVEAVRGRIEQDEILFQLAPALADAAEGGLLLSSLYTKLVELKDSNQLKESEVEKVLMVLKVLDDLEHEEVNPDVYMWRMNESAGQMQGKIIAVIERALSELNVRVEMTAAGTRISEIERAQIQLGKIENFFKRLGE